MFLNGNGLSKIRSISMVHARSFSFTDDSTSVDIPFTQPLMSPISTAKGIPGPHSLETALLLFQFRQIQSSWYQELFQSSRDPLQNSSAYIWQMCQEMREWSDTFPDSLTLSFKDYFDIELLYSYIYCLAPSCRVQAVSTYGKTLIFEYSIAYMQKISPICRDPINTAFYTYHDALRVFFVGSQFLAVLQEEQEQILNGILPYVPIVAGSTPPPPLPANAGIDNVDRSINCINHIKETLKTFGYRWEDCIALLSTFGAQAEPLVATLFRKKHHIDEYSQHNHTSSNYLSQPGYDQLGNRNGDWSNMGPTYMNTNGGRPLQ